MKNVTVNLFIIHISSDMQELTVFFYPMKLAQSLKLQCIRTA